jgi:hypothetical protein
MNNRTFACACVAIGLLVAGRASAAGADATLLRVFLTDGTALVSYGEPARVGDRLVFSMPTSAAPNPPLHLVQLPADRVDWDRTNRYAASARAARYLETQADDDYVGLSNEVARALNELSTSADRNRRLDLAARTRHLLAEWPAAHYHAHDFEVRQMVSLLDEAVADLHAAARPDRFDLSLVAFATPPVVLEPLLPPPTPREAIEQVLTAARAVDTPVERTLLLTVALDSIKRDRAALPEAWALPTRARTRVLLEMERRLDRSYQSMTVRTVRVADRRARAADVRGIERLMANIERQDASLGGRRPDVVRSLIAAVQARLDAARQLQLARDRWALRAPVIQAYRAAIGPPMDLFARSRPALESIKALSGTSPAALARLERAIDEVVTQTSAITPPDEYRSAHALLVSAVQLAANACRIRREATLAGDLARAWDASSAAAGALMLGARARSDIQTLRTSFPLP